MLPVDAVDLVRRWAEAKTPEEFRDRGRIDVEVSQRAITIFESTPMAGRADWLQVPVARLRYSGVSGLWTLYRFDRNSEARLYELLEPHRRIERLLDEIDRDPTPKGCL